MTKRLEYRTLSSRARRLIKGSEGYDVEFKESCAGLKSEDFVAFANSYEGGAILIGVSEETVQGGRQVGKIVGCNVGDKEKLSIINRAESCMPPVEIEIIAENVSRNPFFRVEVPSGGSKPYCTAGGTYKTRGDGRTIPLLPPRLLAMFMQSEGQQFVERFKEATQELEHNFSNTTAQIMKEVQVLLGDLIALDEKLGEVFGSATDAGVLAEEAMWASAEAHGLLVEVGQDAESSHSYVRDIDKKVDALLRRLGIEDPVLAEIQADVKRAIRRLYLEGHRDWDLVHRLGDTGRVPLVDVYKWYEEVVDELQSP